MTAKPPRQKKTPACKQCRQRKIGCDRVRPSCSNCIKRGLTNCEYPERKGGPHNNSGVIITDPTTSVNPNVRTFQPTPQQPPQVPRPMVGNNVPGVMKFKNFGEMPLNININKLPMSSGNVNNNINNNNVNYQIKQFNNQTRNGNPVVNLSMGSQNQEQYIPKYVKTTNMVNIREREEEPEVNEVMFNTRMSSVDINEGNNNGQSVNTRVQLLNENLNAVPHLFNPTDVAAIYAKQNGNSNNHKAKKNKKQSDVDNIVLNQPAPVFFDLMTSVYSQEEILLKEMEFLKDRYVELSHYQSKISTNKSVYTNSDKKGENKRTSKKRKIVDDTSNSTNLSKETTPVNKSEEIKVPFLLLNSIDEMAAANETQLTQLPPTLNNYLNVSPLNLTLNNLISEDPNTKFNKNYIVLRDSFLSDFYQYLITIIKGSFEPNLKELFLSKSRYTGSVSNSSESPRVDASGNALVFLKPKLIIEILKYCSNQLPQLNQIFYPILDFQLDNWTSKINELFIDDTEFFHYILSGPNESSVKLSDLSFIGVVIIMLLFYYYSSDEQKVGKDSVNRMYYEELRTYVARNKVPFIRGLIVIKTKLITQTTNIEDEDTTKQILKFLSLFEVFQQLTYDYEYTIGPIDLNEDVMFALERSINHVNTIQDKDLKSYWKFISGNYLKKKLFEGKIPMLLMNQLSAEYFDNKTPNNTIGGICGNNKSNDEIDKHNFMVSQLKIINYLNGKNDNKMNKVKTINELTTLLNDMDKKYFTFMKQTPLPEHSSSNDIINSYYFKGFEQIDISLQYYKIKLYLEYLIFLQWENYKDIDKVTSQFATLFERAIIPTLLLIFQSSNDDGSEYRFLLMKRQLSLLEDLLDMINSIYQRLENFLSCQKNKINNGDISQDDKDINESLSTLTRTFELLFIAICVHARDCNEWTPFVKKSHPLHLNKKIWIMLCKSGHDINIRSKLFGSQLVTKDPMTGMLSYENTLFEDKYTKVTRQEYIIAAQSRNNGLKYLTDVSKLGRYVKDMKVLLLKLIHLMGHSDIKSLTDLDIWFAMLFKAVKPDLPSCDIKPENFSVFFETFFT